MRMLALFAALVLALDATAAGAQEISPEEVAARLSGRNPDARRLAHDLRLEGRFFEENGPYEVERRVFAGQGVSATASVVAVKDALENWLFLIFDRRDITWRFAGQVLVKQETPTSEWDVIADGAGSAFFTIRQLDSSGTGVSNSVERWFEFRRGEIRKVLEIPREGYVNEWGQGFNREWASTETRVVGDMGLTISLEYRVSYTGDGVAEYEGELFAVAPRIRYTWSAADSHFRLDADASDASGRQILGFVEDGTEQFLRHRTAELGAIASGRDSKKRAWLRRFLRLCSDSPHKQSLAQQLKARAAR